VGNRAVYRLAKGGVTSMATKAKTAKPKAKAKAVAKKAPKAKAKATAKKAKK